MAAGLSGAAAEARRRRAAAASARAAAHAFSGAAGREASTSMGVSAAPADAAAASCVKRGSAAKRAPSSSASASSAAGSRGGAALEFAARAAVKPRKAESGGCGGSVHAAMAARSCGCSAASGARCGDRGDSTRAQLSTHPPAWSRGASFSPQGGASAPQLTWQRGARGGAAADGGAARLRPPRAVERGGVGLKSSSSPSLQRVVSPIAPRAFAARTPRGARAARRRGRSRARGPFF